jgi:predicted kinase
MKKIIILRGIPASGKSTYAKKLVIDNPGMYKRINRDDLRNMLDAYHFSKSNEKFVKKARDFLIKSSLESGKHVIVDDTNISDTNIVRIEQLAKEHTSDSGHDVKIEIKVFDIELSEAIARDKKREKPVGEKVVRKMHRQFYGETKDSPNYRIQDKNLPKALICDLDGTMSLITNRSPFDGSKCGQDLPNTPVVNLIKNYQKLGFKILLLSGRDGQYMPETKEWLAKNEVIYDELWMRAPKDSRKDSIIKRELFETNIENNYTIEFVLDDRNQVVDLWRNDLKLPCFQVYYGDF